MSGFATLLYEKVGPIAFITLNRPQALNVYNIQMRDDLYQVLQALRDDSEVRVGLFKGAGEKAFCAGADLSEFLTAPPPVQAREARWARDLWGLFQAVPQPLIAALHGYVLGSGLEIALSCDLRIAAEDARFGLPEAGLGIIPAAGGTQTLPRAVGRGRALEMVLTGRWLDAGEAKRIGLVNQVIPAGQLWAQAQETARRIASLDPLAVLRAKEAVRRGMELTLSQGLELEKKCLAFLLGANKTEENRWPI